MAPRGTKRKSNEDVLAADQIGDAPNMAEQRMATKTETPSAQENPRKKQKTGISLNQKQALVENLQLEITERARKLRAQYNLQAQGLRTRIEIRVNRIPMALRKAKMGDLVDKYRNGQHPQQTRPTPSYPVSRSARPPPVPEKDTPLTHPPSSLSAASHMTKASHRGPGRPPKQTRNEIMGTNKENTAEPEIPKKGRDSPTDEAEENKNTRGLSPASTNVRSLPRPTPSARLHVTRPILAAEDAPGPSKSPVKQSSASNIFSNLAEKARSTRTGAVGKKGNQSASSTASSATGTVRGRKPAASTTTKATTTTKTQRRASGVSESSESTTSTAAKKSTERSAAAEENTAAAASKKVSVVGTIRRGVAGTGVTKKATTAKEAQASTATGRVLRKRN